MVDTKDSLPKVSILIPTHNRPGYFQIALNSALSQGYPNLEIVVSDNSDDNRTQNLIGPYQEKHENLIYLRTRKTDATQNFKNALRVSTGDYISYLMDDDVFHPEKITRMMGYFLANPQVGLVTSFRKLIDSQGRELPQLQGTEKLFPQDTLVTGQSFGKYILEKGNNVVGEPTTAMIAREDLADGFGWFCGKRYRLLSDVATWLSILAKKNCVYISEPLSYFRIHDAQDQKSDPAIKYRASIEWFNLTIDAIESDIFISKTKENISDLKAKYESLKYHISSARDLTDGVVQILKDVDSIYPRILSLESEA